MKRWLVIAVLLLLVLVVSIVIFKNQTERDIAEIVDDGNGLEKADLIRVSEPLASQTITSPLTIRGEARGYWFFEASFPVMLTDWDGRILGSGIATAEGDWMTEDFVPFSAVVTFENPTYKNNGSLILQKDNPSGLSENDDALEIPIIFAELGEVGEPSSSLAGTVYIGPTCPVVQDPPDGACDDKSYATTVNVFEVHETDNTLFTSVATNEQGEYELTLPIGSYVIQPVGGQPFPTCDSKEISVNSPDSTLALDLSCDTGIR